MSDYNYNRYEAIVSKIVRDYCEVDDDPEFLEIGENISMIPAVKVIFDGFGLAEQLYYNGRTFQMEDDVIMVQNDDYELEALSLDDSDYDHVKEQLELFEQFRNSDGPCNPNMQSFAVFIHRDAVQPDFEFPEHDMTPFGLIHRPGEEVCVYVWWDRSEDTIDVSTLEDRLDSDNAMDESEVMDVLEVVAADNGFDDEGDTPEVINGTPAWPFDRPVEGASKLNPHAAWPFATATVAEPTSEDEEEYEEPDAAFAAAFPGVKIVKQKPEVNDQDYRGILERVVAKHGLPVQVGAKGWISETQSFYYKDKPIANAEDGLKGWLYVERDDDGDGEPSYKDVDELVEVCRAMIEDSNDDETSLNVNVVNPGPDDWEIRSVTIRNDEADGKSWDYEIIMDEDEFWTIVKQVMIENGEIDEPEEGEEIDNDDIDVNSFLWGYCSEMGGEQRFSYGYGVAYMEFDDGFKVGMTAKAGELYIHYYDGKDVTADTVFE